MQVQFELLQLNLRGGLPRLTLHSRVRVLRDTGRWEKITLHDFMELDAMRHVDISAPDYRAGEGVTRA
jgi:hypothetical protein